MRVPVRGFTLVELMIGVVIVAILMLIATPTMQTMRGNARIRTTAESIAHGIRLAQVEAIKRNRDVEFQLNPATGWTLNDPAPVIGGVIQTEPFAVGTTIQVDVTPPGATTITYSGIGAYVDPNPGDGSVPIARVDVTSPTTPNQKELRVVVGPALGTGVRVCDPDFNFPDPIGCPP